MFRNLSTIGLPLSGRPSELIELALSFGFDSMDIDIVDFQQQADVYGVAHARRLMVSARLASGVFHLPFRLDASKEEFDRGLASLPPQLELAAAAECPRMVTSIAAASDEHAFKDFFELHRTRLHTIGDLLAGHGIRLGLAINPEEAAREGRAHGFIHTYEALLGLVAVAHERVGAVVDAWALHVTGESPSIIERTPAGRIIEVRVSDAPRDVSASSLTREQRLIPGETGAVSCAAVLRHARTAGFDGPVTPWADRTTLAGRSRERIVRLTGERMESLWKEADLPIVPRWFTPVARDQFGRPIEDEGLPTPGGMPTPASPSVP